MSESMGKRNWLSELAPPLLVFCAILAIWDRGVVVLGIKPYLVPRPWAVLETAWVERWSLLRSSAMTLAAAGLGFALSLTFGTLIAIAFALSPWVRRSFQPYAVFLQTVPIVAIAPLINLYPGPGFKSVVLLSWMISLFPIITNGSTGLTRVPPEWLELFRLYGATGWGLLWKLRLPNAIPYLVNGAKTSSGLAVVGAVVGDMFCSSSDSGTGLGYWISASSGSVAAARPFAYFFASTLLALAIFLASSRIGSAILLRMGDRQGIGESR